MGFVPFTALPDTAAVPTGVASMSSSGPPWTMRRSCPPGRMTSGRQRAGLSCCQRRVLGSPLVACAADGHLCGACGSRATWLLSTFGFGCTDFRSSPLATMSCRRGIALVTSTLVKGCACGLDMRHRRQRMMAHDTRSVHTARCPYRRPRRLPPTRSPRCRESATSPLGAGRRISLSLRLPGWRDPPLAHAPTHH